MDVILRKYSYWLQENPVLTKSVSSATIAAVGDLIAQIIAIKKNRRSFKIRSTAAFAIFGFSVTGPLIHQFYIWLDQLVPKRTKYSSVLRVLIDRMIFAPPYLLLFFYIVAVLEGHSSKYAIRKIKDTFWTALKMNWKIWTVFQYVNVNYIPQQYRVLFASMVSLVWNIYIASQRI
ncbi:peroxisomal membrane protein 2-like [Tubulanus polymorphus]|uniref:peroxisomal membrane protein 2-like n=1 Tax=Tubulanus polymorphus TaxID=672921 RepID=UPI003DA400C0